MDDLAAAVIHDVKNQLAELALRLERRGDTVQETGIAFDAARRLTDLLLASRQQSGQLQANIDSTSPSDLLQELSAEYQGLFPNLGFTVDTSNAPAFAFYDVALIRLALSNAVHNACRFAKDNVTLSASTKDGFLVFEIADDGAGFPQEMLGAAPVAPTFASARGTGLGIYLAGKIAELHAMEGRRGSVSLSNEDGARFRLSLP
jgi:K+-sensing histidine kinase KdpD